MGKNFRFALIQLKISETKSENLTRAADWIKKAKENGAELVALPECFNSPYGPQYFNENCETIPDGPTCSMLSKAAKDNNLYVIGGTIPEKDGDKLYNTCTVWNHEGKLVIKYRKMHLFDTDVPGKFTLKESDSFAAGSNLSIFSFGNCKIGIGICHDLRFEELAKLYRLQGIELLVYPAAFNMSTGEMHWELLQRGRAIDNQIFVAAVSPSRDSIGSYVVWGHSQVTDPWGKIIANAKEEEEMILADIDLKECDSFREQIPILNQRRIDIYNTILLNEASSIKTV